MRYRSVGIAATVALLLAPALAHAGDTWTTPFPGVRYLYRTTSTPWHVFAAEVDLCASGVGVRVTQPSERQRTTSSFAKLVGAELATNGDFFSYATYGTSGLAVGNANRWTDTKDTSSSGFLAFGYDRDELSPPSAVVDPPVDWMRQVVSGHPQIVTGGVAMATDPDSFCQTRNPRTAAGLSKDRRTLIMAVVDGRSSASVGMKCTELGALMKGLGAWDALNLDGGGSSTMVLSGAGVVNNPSDGSERVVGDHLGVLASGVGEPSSCDRSFEESALDGDAEGASTTTDIDGDGRADVCMRSQSGIYCSLSTGKSFSGVFAGPALSDASGWADVANYGTLRMGDLDGDGRADLCARANAGVICWLSDGHGFSTELPGPALSDANGWDDPAYYGSLRLADVNGDGRDDLCARSASDFRCYPSTGTGFGAPVTLAAIDDATYGDVEHYGTLRTGDVNGDGMADVCIRGANGMTCWPSTGAGFGTAIPGPAWSDASGWSALQYWSTIRLVDVNADGKADLCARAAKGIVCHLSNGNGFGPEITGPAWSDASGWYRHEYYSTLRFADIDGDRDLDVCARAAAGFVCAPWAGAGFGPPVATSLLANAQGWDAFRYYSTIRLADVNGDHKADLCARSSAGVQCWLSDGAGFPTAVNGPGWSDALGFDAPAYVATLRLAGPKCTTKEICGNGRDDDCDGVVDDGCMGGDGGADASTGGDAGGPGDVGEPGGCACRAAGEPSRGAAAWLAGLALFVLAGARRRAGH